MPLSSTLQPGLWVVSTPLGNPGDLSPRAAQTIAEADLVLAEDTRRAGQLLSRCGVVARQFLSLHEHNELERIDFVLQELIEGKTLALVSDAGTPLLCDPGFRLIRACRERGIFVSVVPGPSAALAALVGSGIAPQPFVFLGFLPRKTGEQAKIFAQYMHLPCTLVFFERKDRLADTLQVAASCLGRREVCLARELTKTYEEFIFGFLGEPSAQGSERPFPPPDLLGELTVVIGPPLEEARTEEKQVLALAGRLAAQSPNLKPRALAREVHELCSGWSLKEIYEFLQR